MKQGWARPRLFAALLHILPCYTFCPVTHVALLQILPCYTLPCYIFSPVQVWDLATQECSATLQHHSGKVQAVAWNPDQGSVLLSGSFDKSACLVSS